MKRLGRLSEQSGSYIKSYRRLDRRRREKGLDVVERGEIVKSDGGNDLFVDVVDPLELFARQGMILDILDIMSIYWNSIAMPTE